MLRSTLVATFSFLACSTPLAAQTGSAEPIQAALPANAAIAMAEPMPGDFWNYEIRDEIKGSISFIRTVLVTEVTPTEVSVRYGIAGKKDANLNTYDRSWNLKSSPPWNYRPSDGSGVKSSLKVGDSWRFEADDVNPVNGHIWRRSGQSKVVGQETVTTKAGTFDTFKIETTISRRPTGDPTRTGKIVWQTWYAPSINHWVKRAYVYRVNNRLMTNNTHELVEYGRRQ